MEYINTSYKIILYYNILFSFKIKSFFIFILINLFTFILERIGYKQLNHMKTNIKDFFKKIRNEYCVYNDLVKNRDEIKTKYSAELQKLNVKKEKLWTGKDFSKWELNENEKVDKSLLNKDRYYAFSRMFYKETSYLNNVNNKLGYYNKMVIDELRRLILSHVMRYSEQIKNFSEEFYPTLTDVKIK